MKQVPGYRQTGKQMAVTGKVSLIGCGPGDPDLLTLRAVQHLRDADVLVVDRLVDLRVLDYSRRDAEHIYVGKTPGGASTSQDEINRILIREAARGKQVARLKGGDPFVFGRAVEEMAAIEAAGIEYDIVPGITAALGCASSLRLPVTSRLRHRNFTILTGATANSHLEHDWSALARDGAAFGIYMGVGAAGTIAENLIQAGIDTATPVVVVENGTLPDERSFLTSIGDLENCVSDREIEGPALIYVGLDWDSLGLSKPEKVEHFTPSHAPKAAVPAGAVAEPENKIRGAGK